MTSNVEELCEITLIRHKIFNYKILALSKYVPVCMQAIPYLYTPILTTYLHHTFGLVYYVQDVGSNVSDLLKLVPISIFEVQEVVIG